MIQAVNRYLLIDELNEEVKTESGLLLSGNDKKDMRYGKAKVVSVGSEVSNKENIKDGSVIYYDKRQEYKVVLEGVKYGVIKDMDVIVVL